ASGRRRFRGLPLRQGEVRGKSCQGEDEQDEGQRHSPASHRLSLPSAGRVSKLAASSSMDAVHCVHTPSRGGRLPIVSHSFVTGCAVPICADHSATVSCAAAAPCVLPYFRSPESGQPIAASWTRI